ncbi:MAG: DsbA family protein [Candidatus Lambdaproteobacteria bacterium]|nr:DsbA family protein [Candidatus Lambdaproteobacteria bacterium]
MEKLRATYDVELVWTHFPLHPETPEEGRSLAESYAARGIDLGAANARMQGLMEKEGLPYTPRTMTFNTRRAQELAKWAERQPGGDRIHDALFRAVFVEGRNIAQPDVLAGLLKAQNLPAEEGLRALADGRFAQAVDEDWARCHQLGITGVPTFVADWRGVVGAQPYEVLEMLLQEAGGRRREPLR